MLSMQQSNQEANEMLYVLKIADKFPNKTVQQLISRMRWTMMTEVCIILLKIVLLTNTNVENGLGQVL